MFDNWVTKYALSYSLNGKHWFMVKDKKNNNGKPKVSNCFSKSLNSKKIIVFKSSKSTANTANSLRKSGSILNRSSFSFL